MKKLHLLSSSPVQLAASESCASRRAVPAGVFSPGAGTLFTLVVLLLCGPVFDAQVFAQEADADSDTDVRQTEDIPQDRLFWHVPDPDADRDRARQLQAEAEAEGERIRAKRIRRLIELSEEIDRPSELRISLEEAIHRALATNYALEVARINPAVETTRVVEAQAAFDALFFSNITKTKVDRPSASQLQATQADLFTSSTGIRKLLPTGMQVSGRIEFDRTDTNPCVSGV